MAVAAAIFAVMAVAVAIFAVVGTTATVVAYTADKPAPAVVVSSTLARTSANAVVKRADDSASLDPYPAPAATATVGITAAAATVANPTADAGTAHMDLLSHSHRPPSA